MRQRKGAIFYGGAAIACHSSICAHFLNLSTPPPVDVAIVTDSEEKTFSAEVYPNPASTEFYIHYKLPFDERENVDGTIKLFDLSGKVIETRLINVREDVISFNTDKLKNGMYFYRIDANGKLLNGKISILH